MDALKKRPGRVAAIVTSAAIAVGASAVAVPVADAYPSQCVSGVTTS